MPRCIARVTLSLGIFASAALSTASRSRGLLFKSPPPKRAATVISLMSRVQILPRLASVAAFLCLMLAHLLCPAMMIFLLKINRWSGCCDTPQGLRCSNPAEGVMC